MKRCAFSWQQRVLSICLTAMMLLQCCCCKELLVLLSSPDMRSSHSTFLADLIAAGFSTDVQDMSDSNLRLQRWGRWLYDGVVVLAGKGAEFGGAIDSPYLVELVDSGRNLFIATDEGAGASIRETAAELGTDMLAAGAAVTDHVAHDAARGASAFLASQLLVPAVVGSAEEPILYRGGAATVAPAAVLTAPVLAPAATAATGGAKLTLGPQLALATALHTRKNARFFFLASIDALSNEFYDAHVQPAVGGAASATGNRAFAREAALWTFQEKGMLRIANFKHVRAGEAAPPPLNTYTINDDIKLELDLQERVGEDWRPHVTDSLVAQYVMLDPYIRQKMTHTGGGHYELSVKAPDKYGVFKWVIDYSAPGYSFVSKSEVAPLRPLRHSEYPRFVLQAYPYYAALMSVSVGFFVMITFVMYHE